MADNHKQFQGYLSNIELIGKDLKDLRTSRDANRDRIRKHWKQKLERNKPDFEEQGSFEMGLVIRPIVGDYDLDDGMYLNCIGNNPTEWPATGTVQGWIVDAVKGHTREDPKRMKRCVRVPYQGGYHVDIPAYGKDQANVVRIFKKEQPPTEFDESNPVALVDWFDERKRSHSDLRDLVRFFKGWRDHKKGALLKLKSVAITILISEHIVSNSRNDIAVRDTARACDTHIRLGGQITKPVSPWDDLTSDWTQDDREAVADAFKTLADKGQEALESDEVREGALIWQGQFGSRFPVPDDDGAEKVAAPSIFVKRDVSESQPFA